MLSHEVALHALNESSQSLVDSAEARAAAAEAEEELLQAEQPAPQGPQHPDWHRPLRRQRLAQRQRGTGTSGPG